MLNKNKISTEWQHEEEEEEIRSQCMTFEF